MAAMFREHRVTAAEFNWIAAQGCYYHLNVLNIVIYCNPGASEH